MPRLKTPICERLDIDYPIIQAGMGRGTVNLAAAVSNAGGLGTIGFPEIRSSAREMRATIENNLDTLTSKTKNSFAVNTLLLPPHKVSQEKTDAIDQFIEGALVAKMTDKKVNKQMKILETSGASPEPWIDKINDVKQDTDLLHFHKVGSVYQAKKAISLGVDGITASGFEMGGHTHHPDRAVHTFVLVPAVAEAVDVPVFASGGIRNGAGVLAALALGADAAYMGSRFATTQECDYHENYKKYVVDSEEGDDTLTHAWLSPARVIKSPGLEKLKEVEKEMNDEEFEQYKDQAYTSGRVYGDLEEGILPAGQVATYIKDMPTVKELIDRIVQEAVEIYSNMDIQP